MKSIIFAFAFIFAASNINCLPMPAPEPEPQLEDLFGIFDIFGIFDSDEDYEFENRNITIDCKNCSVSVNGNLVGDSAVTTTTQATMTGAPGAAATTAAAPADGAATTAAAGAVTAAPAVPPNRFFAEDPSRLINYLLGQLDAKRKAMTLEDASTTRSTRTTTAQSNQKFSSNSTEFIRVHRL